MVHSRPTTPTARLEKSGRPSTHTHTDTLRVSTFWFRSTGNFRKVRAASNDDSVGDDGASENPTESATEDRASVRDAPGRTTRERADARRPQKFSAARPGRQPPPRRVPSDEGTQTTRQEVLETRWRLRVVRDRRRSSTHTDTDRRGDKHAQTRARAECTCVCVCVCVCARVFLPEVRLHDRARVGCRETFRSRAETRVYVCARVMPVMRDRERALGATARWNATIPSPTVAGLVAAPFVRRCAPRPWLATRPRSGTFLRSLCLCASAAVGASLCGRRSERRSAARSRRSHCRHRRREPSHRSTPIEHL
jgi:hypothetical protein